MEMKSEEIVERASSIEVNQNGKGEYSFHAKIYFDDQVTESTAVISKLESIYNELHKKFK